MSKMNKIDYIMCLEDTLPYVTKEKFYTALQPLPNKEIDDLLSQPINKLTVDTLKTVWSKVKPNL